MVSIRSVGLQPVRSILSHQAPHGIQIDAGGKLYVVCDISKNLLVIDPVARKIESVIDVEGTGHWLAVLPDASKAYVSNQSGQDYISVVDLKARKMIGKLPAAGGARGIVASSDGKRVFAIQGRAPHLVVIDPAADTILDRIELQGHTEAGYKLRVSLDGRTLLICSDRCRVLYQHPGRRRPSWATARRAGRQEFDGLCVCARRSDGARVE